MKTSFPGISSRAWEHPADRAALAALRKIPGLGQVIRFFLGSTSERSLRLLFLGSAVRVGPRQFSRVHEMTAEATRILDAEEQPDVFVTQNPIMNAGAIGVNSPFISLNSAIVERLTDDELLSVIAHEMGHVLSGHVLYKTLLWLLVNITNIAVRIPLSGILLAGVVAALREWDRKSELSADRAGLLVVQDTSVSYSVLMKLAGGTASHGTDIEAYMDQARDYEAAGDILDGVYKLLNLLDQTHPFPVLRLAELRGWVDGGSYHRILNGDYPRRDDDPESVRDDFAEAGKQYEEDINRSADPLAGVARTLGKGVDDARKQAQAFFETLFGGKGGPPPPEEGNDDENR